MTEQVGTIRTDGSVVTVSDAYYGAALEEVQAIVGFDLANRLDEAVSERLYEAQEQAVAASRRKRA